MHRATASLLTHFPPEKIRPRTQRRALVHAEGSRLPDPLSMYSPHLSPTSVPTLPNTIDADAPYSEQSHTRSSREDAREERELGLRLQALDPEVAGQLIAALGSHVAALRLVLEAERRAVLTLPASLRVALEHAQETLPAFLS